MGIFVTNAPDMGQGELEGLRLQRCLRDVPRLLGLEDRGGYRPYLASRTF